MKHPHSFLMVSLLLLCCTQTITFAQSTASLTIPESLRGYWQFKTDNVSDWNGPLIGENFVENFYTVFYVEQMEQEADGSYFFHLRNQKGDTTEFRITPVFMTPPSSGTKAGKNRGTASASKSPTIRNCFTPTNCPTSFIGNG